MILFDFVDNPDHVLVKSQSGIAVKRGFGFVDKNKVVSFEIPDERGGRIDDK